MRSEDLKKCEETLTELYEMLDSICDKNNTWDFGDIYNGEVILYKKSIYESEEEYNIPINKFSSKQTLLSAISEIDSERNAENNEIATDNDAQMRSSFENKERKLSKRSF